MDLSSILGGGGGGAPGSGSIGGDGASGKGSNSSKATSGGNSYGSTGMTTGQLGLIVVLGGLGLALLGVVVAFVVKD